MIIDNSFEQNSEAWLRARLGIPTASGFDQIVTRAGKPSASREKYMNKLVAEWFLDRPLDDISHMPWIERGHHIEDEAARAFAFLHSEIETTPVGIVYRDESQLAACSPDRQHGGNFIEIKSPAPHTQVGYLTESGEIPRAYFIQVQGSMAICELEEWYFFSYHPELPSVDIVVERDDKWCEIFLSSLDAFIEEMMEKREKLRSKVA